MLGIGLQPIFDLYFLLVLSREYGIRFYSLIPQQRTNKIVVRSLGSTTCGLLNMV